MSRNRVEDFRPYQDSVKPFGHVVEDMAVLQTRKNRVKD